MTQRLRSEIDSGPARLAIANFAGTLPQWIDQEVDAAAAGAPRWLRLDVRPLG